MSGIALALILGGVVVIRGALKGLNPVDAVRDIFDRSLGGEGINPAGTTTTTTTGQFSAGVEQWRSLVAAHFPAPYVEQALSVMECESGGKATARNPTSSASGLFQHLPKFWDSRSRQAGVPGANIYDPTANVKVAAWLFKQSYTWAHWSCQPTVGVSVGGSGGRKK